MNPIVMERSSADNKYLHRDFHKTLELGIAYLGQKFGEASVKEYLELFVKQYYGPLIGKIKENGLSSLARYFVDLYEAEEASDALELTLTSKQLSVHVRYCPALKHFEEMKYVPSPWFPETTTTVHAVLAKESGLHYDQEFYDLKTGECRCVFTVE